MSTLSNSSQTTHSDPQFDNNESEESEESDSDENPSLQLLSLRQAKKRVRKSASAGGEYDFPSKTYTDAAAWLQRTRSMDINWHAALTRGLPFYLGVYTPYKSKKKYEQKFQHYIECFNLLVERIPSCAADSDFLKNHIGFMEKLGTEMSTVAGQTRSNNISTLKDRFIKLLAQDLPGVSEASLPSKDDKSDRGFHNVHTARLLCPAALREIFDANPDQIMAELENGISHTLPSGRVIQVDATAFPSFMWWEGGFIPGPENFHTNLLRSNTLVRVFRHIFTGPLSARKSLDEEVKSFVGHAKREKMETVTPGSIAYACYMLRHGATSNNSYKKDDRLFSYEKYYERVVAMLDKSRAAANVEWIEDTIKWWNIRVFGTHSPTYGQKPDLSSNSDAYDELVEAEKFHEANKRRRIDLEQGVEMEPNSEQGNRNPSSESQHSRNLSTSSSHSSTSSTSSTSFHLSPPVPPVLSLPTNITLNTPVNASQPSLSPSYIPTPAPFILADLAMSLLRSPSQQKNPDIRNATHDILLFNQNKTYFKLFYDYQTLKDRNEELEREIENRRMANAQLVQANDTTSAYVEVFCKYQALKAQHEQLERCYYALCGYDLSNQSRKRRGSFDHEIVPDSLASSPTKCPVPNVSINTSVFASVLANLSPLHPSR
ncbi:hypothetical protein CVT24_007512 [Panaeolus cyanescens]|uniref:Uncharacterized protein n=1 Tax=Panaeolus cyanescens TaxID=181874 RepID=A0A409YL13_9AGAR|nr:hypothetical protein CVT24_007512 [Panaeolus cyanescens]